MEKNEISFLIEKQRILNKEKAQAIISFFFINFTNKRFVKKQSFIMIKSLIRL